MSEAGKKYDQGKAPVDQGLLQYFPRALELIAQISQYGAEKYKVPYSDKNWERVENGEGRYRDAAGRHITREAIEGLYDPESGKLHLAHRGWNTLAALELLARRLEAQDQNEQK